MRKSRLIEVERNETSDCATNIKISSDGQKPGQDAAFMSKSKEATSI